MNIETSWEHIFSLTARISELISNSEFEDALGIADERQQLLELLFQQGITQENAEISSENLTRLLRLNQAMTTEADAMKGKIHKELMNLNQSKDAIKRYQVNQFTDLK